MLYPPYSVFTVEEVHAPTVSTPYYCITLLAAKDNLLENEALPLALWS